MGSREIILQRLRQAASAPVMTSEKAPLPAPFFTADWETFAASLTRVKTGFSLARDANQAKEAFLAALNEHSIATACMWKHPLLEALGVRQWLEESERAVLGHDRAATADCGVTAADAALPETGTVIVRAAVDQPRSVSLLPRVHLAFVRSADLRTGGVDDLPQLLESWRTNGQLPSAVHAISGPSSTADIEQVHVMGVHGPTAVHVFGLDFEV